MTRRLNPMSFAAAHNGPGPRRTMAPQDPGLQQVWALCEVTGGGRKVYGTAVEFSEDVDSTSLALDTFQVLVSAGGGGGGPPGPPPGAGGPPGRGGRGGGGPPPFVRSRASKSDEDEASPRKIVAVYTNADAELLSDQKSVPGPFVIVEFQHDSDLSAPSRDGDAVSVVQEKTIKAASGVTFEASKTTFTNKGGRGNSTITRGVDDWEQNHWWWDDSRAAWLEYSIYLPKGFLQEGGEKQSYPLVLAITHSGTSYDGTCIETLVEQNIATIWSLPEEQAERECVVITPRYERTTLNDYWEHTLDVENTHRLVESFLTNTWDYGNPNKPDRADKVLKIDPARVYCTGWSMGAMTSLWLMAKHPDTYAAGLIIAGQQRPKDVVDLAHQKLLILTGTRDTKATPWNERCCEEWARRGGKVTRPTEWLDRGLIFPVDDQRELTGQIEGYVGEGGNITFLTFADVDHMESCRAFFHIKAAREWLFRQSKDA